MKTINVTAEDIAAGKRKNAGCCPVALALKRETGKECFVAPTFVLSDKTYIDSPREVYFFIITFDAGLPVEPFSFVLDI